MSTTIIITICCLLLLAYVFDITAPHTRVPSVILLLLSGWLVKQLCDLLQIGIPDLQPLLPILGSVGLILIVLEGSLELELNRQKKKVIFYSVISALIPVIVLGSLFALLFNHYGGYGFRRSLINVMPLCVISSSIAISVGRSLNSGNREFITYESSLSDIIGVLCFNFVVLNESLNSTAIAGFSLQLFFILIISFSATAALSWLLHRVKHHIKFAPIILLVILIYEVSKVYHLPALIFILIFGLFLGNLDEFKNVQWIQKLRPNELDLQARKFREIVTEATFLIRALFFLLFGYLIKSSQILNVDTFIWALLIVVCVFTVRGVVLKMLGYPLFPLMFIAPRGLITILLYFAIPLSMRTAEINDSLILQVIVLTSLVMMLGTMMGNREQKELVERHETI